VPLTYPHPPTRADYEAAVERLALLGGTTPSRRYEEFAAKHAGPYEDARTRVAQHGGASAQFRRPRQPRPAPRRAGGARRYDRAGASEVCRSVSNRPQGLIKHVDPLLGDQYVLAMT